ncbi:GATA zinc finger domain-containing protein 14-like [Sabethes cyaneus]|uniref:GATA zinc finger domain-containing protein 14-like n=1 Tax=Sabethes cyaneus TaxID=53552 RepID=UPI00237D70B0|nr:GATA zinc finger domain-containing protein 14-like [Sabethes cyaneus]
MDRIEALLGDVKKELTTYRSAVTTGLVSGIKNYLTSLIDLAMQTSNKDVVSSMQSMSSGMSELNDEIKRLTTVTIDMAANSTMQHYPTIGLEILDELKILSTNFAVAHKRNVHLPTPPAEGPSLYAELNAGDENENMVDNSGWRVLGNKKVWKASWLEYDQKESRRLEQERRAEQARSRRRRNRRNRNVAHNNNVNNNRRQNNYNNNRRNINNNNNHRGNSNNNNVNFRSNSYYSNNNRNTNRNNRRQNNYNSNRSNINNNNNNHRGNSNNNNVNFRSNSYYSNNNRNTNRNNRNNNSNRNFNYTRTQNQNTWLPPDRVLLAAAKDQFSRPPANYHPSIQFQRGEILNPYPVNGNLQRSLPAHTSDLMAPGHPPGGSCDACSCRHTCFRSTRRTP